MGDYEGVKAVEKLSVEVMPELRILAKFLENNSKAR